MKAWSDWVDESAEIVKTSRTDTKKKAENLQCGFIYFSVLLPLD